VTTPAQLPIGVVLPTRNSRALLPRHLESIRYWRDLVSEIVVVDSESNDGTVEFLREQLPSARARFLSHSPGLYESWNFGIGQLRAEFAYISSIGDTITPATLARLVEIARERNADAVVSLPRFTGPGARRVRGRWPLEQCIARRGLREPYSLSGLEAFVWSAVHVPAGLLGSSASNLYRTRFLQEHPFPTCYRRVGDTGWAIENAFQMRLVVAPGLESEFLVHPPADAPTSEPVGQTRRRLHTKAREIFEEQLKSAGASARVDELAGPLGNFWQATDRLLDANARYQELRRERGAALLNPVVWRARWHRFLLRRQAARCRETILRKVDSLACQTP